MSITRYTTTVLDHAQVAKPIEVTVADGEYGTEVVVVRGNERARIVLDYFAGRLIVKQYGRKDYSSDAELGRLEITFQ